MKPSLVGLAIVGAAISITGLALRLLIDGNLIQIPFFLLFFGGLALIVLAVQKGKKDEG